MCVFWEKRERKTRSGIQSWTSGTASNRNPRSRAEGTKIPAHKGKQGIRESSLFPHLLVHLMLSAEWVVASTLGMTAYFTESTNSNPNYTQKYCHRFTHK